MAKAASAANSKSIKLRKRLCFFADHGGKAAKKTVVDIVEVAWRNSVIRGELKVGLIIRFPLYTGLWQVVSIVERGAILVSWNSSNSQHKHLAEWVELEQAIAV